MTSTEFDQLIHDALEADARRAPSGAAAWAGPSLATVPIQRRRASWLLVAPLAVAAAATVALIVKADRPPVAEQQAVGFQPAGAEYPLTDLGAATSSLNGLTVASLAGATQVPGQPPVFHGPVVQYSGGVTAELMSCVSGGCAPEWLVGVPHTGISSTVDNGDGEFDVWMWSNVPSGTAYVEFTQGTVQLWQTPIHGMVQFPYAWLTRDLNPPPGATDDHQVNYTALPYSAVAFDAAGVPLADASQASIDAAYAGVAQHEYVYADITRSQGEELIALTDATIRTCLAESDATFSADGSIANLPQGGDDQAIWDGCVERTKTVVGEAVAALNPRFYDTSIGERPLVDDPFLNWGP